MSVLTLIRHGQASFFADNYDQLSELGERQARALGEYWARRELKFDEVYTGPRVRQSHSAELAVAAARHRVVGAHGRDPDVADLEAVAGGEDPQPGVGPAEAARRLD